MVTWWQRSGQAARLRCVAAAAMTALLLVGACAGPSEDAASSAMSHEQYQRAIDEIMAGDDTRAASRLFTEVVATSYEKSLCEEQVRALHERLGSIVDAAEELRPPADAADGHRRFLGPARESVRLVGAAADDVAAGELTCGQPLNQRIYGLPSTVQAQQAIDELERSGYRVFGE